MKKKYTVDELLSSKPKETIQPTKLQHLKIQSKEEEKIAKSEKLWQSIQDDEVNIPPMKLETDQKINDFVVAELKSSGLAVNQSNIDYFTKVVKEELNREGEKEPYKFVNPYTK